jgi:DNA-directed RNA polymerase II subunit RPB1
LSSYQQRKGSVTQAVKIGNEDIPAGVTKLERQKNGIPVYGSLSDPRMGASDGSRCVTCNCQMTRGGNQMNDCPGHFGHIELCTPVYHCGFIDEVTKILRCVCFYCSRLLLDENKPTDRKIALIGNAENRFRCIHDHLNKTTVKCEISSTEQTQTVQDDEGNLVNKNDILPEIFGNGMDVDKPATASLKRVACGKIQPKYKKEGLKLRIKFPGDQDAAETTRERDLSAKEVFEVFRKLSDEDVKTLGFDPKYARPEWMLVSVLPVPPPHVRPSVKEGDMQSEDDLTFQLTNILKVNLSLQDALRKGGDHGIRQEYESILQNHVTAMFDNERDDTPRVTQKTGRPLKTIRQRLKGKEGRLRGNLMGKRVNFSARTVITADPNLSIDQVGVPRSIALTLTFPEIVTRFNKEELTQLVRKGPDEWPGAKSVIRRDGVRIAIGDNNKDIIQLEDGWIVERHLRDDDVVLFNRQPSLHKMSIMGHRAKVLDWSTFRLNLSVTTPYNADFDGDEMNLHLPQSLAAKADANELMMVPRNIVTPQSNRNVMGIVQDALLGVTRMTKRDVFVDKEVLMNTLMWLPDNWDRDIPAPAILKPKPLWTGKQLFSLICPNINYKGKSKNHAEPKIDDYKDPFNFLDSEVLIHGGMLLQGIVDKNTVGASGGSMVHVCWLQKGWEETRRFMNQLQAVVNYWMVNTSYSVGVSDTVADATTIQEIQKTLDEAKEKVKEIMSKAQRGALKMMPGKPLMESFEVNINEVLNDARSTVGKKAQQSLKDRNAIKGTVMAGSKGSELNISQIIACVGQQNVQGKRIRYGFIQRTLPHFAKDDLGMESRGFVENSYLRGLSPQEFFFHAMGGREGCIDTAVKTSETGYIQRRLVKAMETVMAQYDTTLRNSHGCVMQFLYGEDGMDAQRIEKQVFDSYTLTAPKFREMFYLDVTSEYLGRLNYINTKTNERAYYMHPVVVESCRNDPELRMLLDEEYEQLLRDRVELRQIMGCRGSGSESDPSTYLPVNIDRLIWNAQRQFHINTNEPCPIHPKVVLEAVSKIWTHEHFVIVRGNDPISKEAQQNATLLFQMLIRSKLATKRVLRDYRLTKEALQWLVQSIISDFRSSVVNPGEMCGVLAAQSIGEPATQMTLNTFHNTGISAKNVTLGVPRLNEILNVGKNIKTPSCIINLQNRNDQKEATNVISLIEYTTLGDITVRTEIHYDPDPTTTVVEDDQELVEFNTAFEHNDVSPWVLRVVLDDKFVNTRVEQDPSFSLEIIAEKVKAEFNDTIQVMYSDVNSTTGFVLRIRMFSEEGDDIHGVSDDYEVLRSMQRKILDDVHLFGVPGIKKVYLSEKKGNKWDDEKGFEISKEWVLETDGTNLAEIMVYPQVDHTSTVSNDLVEMFHVLGIEGARASLFNELRGVLSFDGAYVNYRHIASLADCMTFGGYLMAVSRHGINKSESGPLLRASFEETVEVFMKSAAFSHYDVLNGVTENVMLGQLGKLGTGIVDLIVDTDKLQHAIEIAPMESTFMNEDKKGGLGSATPYSNTPYITSPGYNLGNITPMIGSFTPAAFTPHASHGSATPAFGYQSAASPMIYQSMATANYLSMSPARSAASGGSGYAGLTGHYMPGG